MVTILSLEDAVTRVTTEAMALPFLDCTLEDMTHLLTLEDEEVRLTTEGLPEVTGARLAGDVVMESLLAALVQQELIIDNTT